MNRCLVCGLFCHTPDRHLFEQGRNSHPCLLCTTGAAIQPGVYAPDLRVRWPKLLLWPLQGAAVQRAAWDGVSC
jgi:hypothetical protein